MLPVTNAFNEAFKSDLRNLKMRIKINGVVYYDENIFSFNYHSGSIAGDSFGIGSTFANTIKLTLGSIVEGLKQLDVVEPEIGIEYPSYDIEYVKLGTFLISEQVNPDRNENRTSLECTDRMIMLDDKYVSKLKYPAKIRDVALEIANLAGVEVDKVSFSRLMENTIKKPVGYTYRQALGLIAQFEAGYVTFDRNGLLAIRQLEDKNYQVTPDEYFLKGLTKNELLFRPAGIEVKVSEDSEKVLTIGNKKGSVIHLENKIMTDQLLRLVYEKIKNINYYPYSLKWRGNPAVEAGDWLRVTDTKGNEFKVPNLSYSLEYKGGLTATSTVETVASNEVRMGYKTILEQTIEYVNDSIRDAKGNVISYGVEEPLYPKEGDVWFKYKGPDTEIWIYKKIGETDKLDWVFQISSAIDNELLLIIEDVKKAAEEAKLVGEDAKEAGQQALEKALEAEKAGQEASQKGDEALLAGQEAKAIGEQASLKGDEALILGEEAKKAGDEAKKVGEEAKIASDEATKISQKAKEASDQSLISSAESLQKAEEARKEAFDSSSIAKQAEKDALSAIAKGEGNSSEIKKLDTELKGTVSKVEGNTAQIATLKIESDKVSSTVGKVEADLDSMNPDFMNSLKGSDIDLWRTEQTSSSSMSMFAQGLSDKKGIQFYRNKRLALSCEIGCNSADFLNGADGNIRIGFELIIEFENGTRQYAGCWKIYEKSESYRGRINGFARVRDLPIKSINLGGIYIQLRGGSVYAGKPKVAVTESLVSSIYDWSLSPEDAVSVQEYSSFVQTSKGFQQTVNSDISGVKSQQTQMAGQLTSTVEKVDNLEIGGTNIFLGLHDGLLNRVAFSGTTGSKSIVDDPTSPTKKSVMSKILTYSTGNLLFYFGNMKNSANFEKGKEYTLSFNMTSEIEIPLINCSINQADVIKKSFSEKISGASKRQYITFKPQADSSGLTNMNMHFTVDPSQISKYVDKKFYLSAMKIEKGNTVTDWSPSPVDLAERSQITQLENLINLKVEKANVIAQINISPEVILFQAKRIHLSGESLIDNAVIKTAMIADATITNAKIVDLSVTTAKIANLSVDTAKIANLAVDSAKIATLAVDTGHIKDLAVNTAKIANLSVDEGKIANLAVTNAKIKDLSVTTAKIALLAVQEANIGNLVVTNGKIANLSVNNAKIADLAVSTAKIGDAAITNAKIGNAAITDAKIQNATISDAKIISITANKIVANTLSAITTNTGQLNVTGWLDFTTENRGLRGTFDFYDVPDDSYYSRWYDGEMRMSHRHLILTSNIYNVNNNSTRGAFKYYSETLYGPDYVKLRQYKGEDKKTVLSRVDIRADAIEIGKDWSFTKSIILKTDGTSVFGGRALFNDGMDVSVGLRVGRIEAPMNYQSLIFNEGRNLGTIELTYDGKRLIRSMDIYDRTYNSQPTVCITDQGTLGRIVSARKYKSDIQTAYDLIEKAKSIISIQPKSWVDKKEMNGKRHYGFIADEFEESNLKEVVFYNSKGEVEGLAYDRISMYQNVVLTEHEKKISDLEIKILKLEEIINNGK